MPPLVAATFRSTQGGTCEGVWDLQAISEEAGMSSGCGEEGTVGGLGKDWGRQATWGRQGLGAVAAEEVGAGGGGGGTDWTSGGRDGDGRWWRRCL